MSADDRALLNEYQVSLSNAKEHHDQAQMWDEAFKDFWKVARFAEVEKMTFTAAMYAIITKRYEENTRSKSYDEQARQIKERIPGFWARVLGLASKIRKKQVKSPVQSPEG